MRNHLFMLADYLRGYVVIPIMNLLVPQKLLLIF